MGTVGDDSRNWLTRKRGLKECKPTYLSLDTVSKVYLYKEDASMNWKLLVKYSFISALLVVFALCLLLPLQKIDAGSPEPTPSTRMKIITMLQPGWTANAELNQFDGRLIEEAPSPSEVEESPANTVDQQTHYAIADAIILEGYPAVNNGNMTDMWAGYDEYLDPYGRIARSLVKFAIEDIDADLIFIIRNTPAVSAGVTIDSNRYIDINPDGGRTGSTNVDIQVQDTDSLTDTDTLNVTVTGGSNCCLNISLRT